LKMARLTTPAATTTLLLTHLIIYLQSNNANAFTLHTYGARSTKIASTRLYNNNQKATLREALRTLSGKLTTSPEIVLPEPSDPTAILLQTSAIQKLSKSIRDDAKANTVWIDGSSGLSNLATFCKEQEEARGNFPGPVPVIYCPIKKKDSNDIIETLSSVQAAKIASTGALGILLPIHSDCITSLDDIRIISDAAGVNNNDQKHDDEIHAHVAQYYKSYSEAGLEPIPEVLIDESFAAECNVEELVDIITDAYCGGMEPVAVLLTVHTNLSDDDDNNLVADNEEDDSSDSIINDMNLPLPSVPKSLKKRIPILCSINCAAQQISMCAARHKEAGFTGSILRAECVPGGGRMNPDLKFVGDFWTYIVSDLKSARSKSFGFRSKMDQLNAKSDVPAQWAAYQQDVMSSGALGSNSIGQDPSFKSEDGSYKGF